MKLKRREKTELSEIKKELISFFNQALPLIIASFLVLIVFFVVVDAYEYLTTEYWWIQDSISYKQTTVFLFLLIALASLINWDKLLKKKRKIAEVIVLCFILTLIGHKAYTDYYLELKTYPKVKNISKDWGLPGSWVKIEGRNFGLPHEAGKVYLGEEEMMIKKWEDKEIIFEIPVIGGVEKSQIKIKNKFSKFQKQTINFYLK